MVHYNYKLFSVWVIRCFFVQLLPQSFNFILVCLPFHIFIKNQCAILNLDEICLKGAIFTNRCMLVFVLAANVEIKELKG